MNTVSVVDDKTGKVIASITDYSGVIQGVCLDGYSVNVDAEKLDKKGDENIRDELPESCPVCFVLGPQTVSYDGYCLYEKIRELLDNGCSVKFDRHCLLEDEYYKCLKITVFDGEFRASKLLAEYELQNWRFDKDELISEILGYLEGEIKSKRNERTNI